MFWLMIVASLAVFGAADDAPTLVIQKTSTPTPNYIESYSPIHFRVAVIDKCDGVGEAQFALIGLFGPNQGINIVPTWDSAAQNSNPTKFRLDIYAVTPNTSPIMITNFTSLAYKNEKMTYEIMIDSNEITLTTLNAAGPVTTYGSINSAQLPDFFDGKYRSLTFFQPIQTGDNAKLNNCNFEVQYNGKLIWTPPVGAPETPLNSNASTFF